MTKIFCCIAVVVAVYRRIGVCCIDNISAGKTREIFKWTPVFRKSFQVIPCGHLNSPPPPLPARCSGTLVTPASQESESPHWTHFVGSPPPFSVHFNKTP